VCSFVLCCSCGTVVGVDLVLLWALVLIGGWFKAADEPMLRGTGLGESEDAREKWELVIHMRLMV